MRPYLEDGFKILDVGSATGRLLYELASSGISFESLTGCEISELLSGYARGILLGGSPDTIFPCVGDSSYKIEYRKMPERELDRIRTKCSKSKIEIANTSVNGFAQSGKAFDVVFCLNVADRHPSPRALIADLSSLVKNGGTICMACAFDWARSPARAEEYCDNLNGLFGKDTWTMLEDRELNYTIVGGARQAYDFRTQVAIFRRE